MNRTGAIAILVVGLFVLGWALNASDSVGSGFSRIFTGTPTNKTIILAVVGGLLVAAGLGSLVFPRGRKPS